MTARSSIEKLLADSERELDRFAWEGTFADYLRMVTQNPSVARLSHQVVHDAIMAKGVEESARGEPIYALFRDDIFGLNDCLSRIARYFASASRRLEIRKRILLLLGPPASGKSTIVTLIKRALEDFTRTDQGAVYAIKGCPMQEEPLHLVPDQVRSKFMEDHDIHIEGDLCPRCRYMLRSQYKGRISEVPVTRVTFSEFEAIGIGYYVATSPNPSDASLLVGSVDTSRLEGDRLEVAGKAFRMDGEFNVANRGLMELVEIFKADKRLLTTLLGLAQEQLVKMERFGSIYADEVIIAHTNEGDLEEFKADEHSEALRDRIIEIRIPYNLRVSDEVKIYRKMVKASSLEDVHLAPLTLTAMSVFAVLSRLAPPTRQGMSLLDKLRLYDDQKVPRFSLDDVVEMKRHHPDEGMGGISPRYMVNRLSAVASLPQVRCISPLRTLDSLWRGLGENVSFKEADIPRYIGFIKDALAEHNNRAVREVQRAFKEGFEQSASELLSEYLAQVDVYISQGKANERDMRDIERQVRVSDRDRQRFRREIHQFSSSLNSRGISYDYTVEPRLKAAIEARLFPSRRQVQRTLTKPRFARQRVEWRRERTAVYNRLVGAYGYCDICADDLIEYVVHVLKGTAVLKTPKNEDIEWQWNLAPDPPSPQEESS